MGSSEARRPPPDGGAELWPSELLISEVVGRLIEFWGFKRSMGRVWAMIYLRPEPVSAQDLRDLLGLSSGAVSMTLAELVRWGVVRKVWLHGERRDHYSAEVHLWKMISRVLSERERAEIAAAAEACEEALRFLHTREQSADASERTRARHQIERVEALYDLALLGQRLLAGLLSSASLDLGPLARFVLGPRSRS